MKRLLRAHFYFDEFFPLEMNEGLKISKSIYIRKMGLWLCGCSHHFEFFPFPPPCLSKNDLACGVEVV